MKNTHRAIQVNHHSIAAAAGALKIPVAVLRQAKKAGAAGFRANGNFDLLEFVRWLATKGRDFKPRKSLEESKALLAEAQADRLTRQGEVERGELCPIQTQKRALSLIVNMLFVCIRQTSQNDRHTMKASFANMLLNSVAAVAGTKNLDLPDWALEAIREGTENTFGKDEADFSKRMEIFGGILAGRTIEQIEAKLANPPPK